MGAFGVGCDAVSVPEVAGWRIVGNAYPNPAMGVPVIIPLEVDARGAYTARVFDALGRAVREVVGSSGTGEIRWDGTNARGVRVPSGVYFLEVSQGRDVISRQRVRVAH